MSCSSAGSGGRPFPAEVRVDGCAAQPCTVRKGSTIYMQMDWNVGSSTATLKPKVMATALGTTIPYILPPDMQNACNHLANANCPLDAGERPTYKFQFYVANIYPSVRVTIELSLIDQRDQTTSCFNIDLSVVS